VRSDPTLRATARYAGEEMKTLVKVLNHHRLVERGIVVEEVRVLNMCIGVRVERNNR